MRGTPSTEPPRAPRRIVLEIDVDTLRGTLEGLPPLVELLRGHDAGATFLFALGPDRCGRAVRRMLREGTVDRAHRASLVEHYGRKALLYGTLLPGPDIGRRGAAAMRAVRDAGFEVGIHCWDHAGWEDGVRGGDAGWTAVQMRRAIERFRSVFGEAPRVHAAAGWQMNVHAFRLLQREGFGWASDTRGTHPFVPVYNAEVIRCPQYPTTLPTLDELLGPGDLGGHDVVERLLALTDAARSPQVFTLHADLEGMTLLPMVDSLLAGWRAQGWQLASLRQVAERVSINELPRHEIVQGLVPGRSREVTMQGAEFPSPAATSATPPGQSTRATAQP